MRNIRNHLTADPKAKIVVVTHAGGINFLLKDAKDKNGNPFEVDRAGPRVEGRRVHGLRVHAASRATSTRSTLIEEAKLVPSGVAEVSRLQAQEGYVVPEALKHRTNP